MIKKREILVATLKAKEKVAKAIERHDRLFSRQEIPNANSQTPESQSPVNVPSQPIPNNGG